MKKILILCMAALLVTACADNGPVAPKEGRQSVGTVLEEPAKSKNTVKPEQAQSVKTWAFSYKTAANNRPHAKVSGEKKLTHTVSVGKGINDNYQTLAGPVVSGDTVYTLDSHFNLQATDLKTAKALWRKPLATITGTTAKSIGLAVYHKKLYAVAGNGLIIAMDLSGNSLWTRELKAPLRSTPILDNNRLFVSSIHNELFALNADNGKDLWKYTGDRAVTNFFGMGAPAVQGNIVIMPTTGGRVVALEASSGMLLWTEDMWTQKTYNPILDIPHMTAAPVIEGSNVYLVGNAGKTGLYRLSSGIPVYTIGIGGRETPALSGNTLYVVTNQKDLMALDKTQGKLFWKTALTALKDRDNEAVWFGPVLVNNAIIVVSSLGDIVFYNAKTGQEMRHEKQDELVGAPIVVGETLLFLTTDGNLLFYQ
ncbi:MAG: PQQ-binding-like beta-propeller repeat protein [Alphaproteobacteria bacterium]|nr:PQQ-binding-like beta-propeller repeat protein [Alphaproteobacteria bacterium]